MDTTELQAQAPEQAFLKETKPAAEALEEREKQLEALANKGMEGEALLRSLEAMAQERVQAETSSLTSTDAWVASEGPEAASAAEQSATEAKQQIASRAEAFLQEARQALGVTEAASEASADAELTKTLEQTEKTIAEISGRQPLDPASQAYLALMESYRSLIKAEMNHEDIQALTADYNAKTAAYQSLTKDRP